jgi:phosphoribosylformylglycinamidine cyclo-ligase
MATYETSGVARLDQRDGFKKLLGQLKQTWGMPASGVGRPRLDFGAYAAILDIPGFDRSLAVSTDGVGTKAIVAQLVDKYDTVGIDCVAMNVNDVLCVGAEPFTMLDYIAVEVAEDRLLAEIGIGLRVGAEQAGINIPAGEISQIKEIVRSERPGYGFDLVGTALGLVGSDEVISGADVKPGDVIVGLASSGIHSNGLTLARDVLLNRAGYAVGDHIAELGRTVGEELLEPTRIYAKAVVPVLRERLGVTSLSHITSDGYLNLARASAPVGYEITDLPAPQPIFELIQQAGNVRDEEMFQVYNMGVGFCITCTEASVARVRELASAAGSESHILGHCTDDPSRTVHLRPKRLTGRNGRFHRD